MAILQRMAALRAARAALAIREALMSHEGDANDVEALRAAVEVRDALSDGQFNLTREADSMVVALPQSAMHDVLRGALGEDPHSRWRVRIP